MIQPLRDNLLTIPEDMSDEEKTASGIITTRNIQKMTEQLVAGKVIRIGPDVKNVKVGDIVLHHSNRFIVIDGEDYQFLMKEENVIAIDNERTKHKFGIKINE